MSGGHNILSMKKGGEAPDIICGKTIILAMHLLVHPHRVVNGHGPQFRSDSTLVTAHGRVNQNGTGHLDNCLDSMFSNAVLMSRTSSTKADVLVLFN